MRVTHLTPALDGHGFRMAGPATNLSSSTTATEKKIEITFFFSGRAEDPDDEGF